MASAWRMSSAPPPSECARRRAQQRMVGREGGGELEIGEDDGAQRLGQLDALGPGGLAAPDPAHQDERPLGLEESPRRLLGQIGRRPDRRRRQVALGIGHGRQALELRFLQRRHRARHRSGPCGVVAAILRARRIDL